MRFSRDRLKEAKETREGLGTVDAPSLDAFFDGDEELASETGENGRIQFSVTSPESGGRLDVVMSGRRPDFSRSSLARLAKEGLVLVDERPAKPSVILSQGQTVSFQVPITAATELLPDFSVKLQAIYEDDDILVINKNWGLAVHPAPGYHGPTVVGGLLALNQDLAEVGDKHRSGLVHRLDKDTSGVLITAKNEKALLKLSKSFSQRETVKRYLAFVRGRPKNNHGLIDSPIGRHPTQRHKMAAGVKDGRPARTFWRLIKYFPDYGISLLLLNMISGRTHQARVHLQSMGFPVLADPVYSRGVADLLKSFPALEPYLQRQMLHARRLSIAHPTTGRLSSFHAPWPEDFINLFNMLGAYRLKT